MGPCSCAGPIEEGVCFGFTCSNMCKCFIPKPLIACRYYGPYWLYAIPVGVYDCRCAVPPTAEQPLLCGAYPCLELFGKLP